MRTGFCHASLALIALFLCSIVPASAQNACVAIVRGDPPRSVIRCSGGLVLELEAASALRLVAGGADASPSGAILTSRAALIEVRTKRPFRIVTPQAIASVRGTVYAVDVADGTTAVFVVDGRVDVTRRGGTDGVSLGRGEGVDVRPGQALTVRRWPQERADRLLARFGR